MWNPPSRRGVSQHRPNSMKETTYVVSKGSKMGEKRLLAQEHAMKIAKLFYMYTYI